MDVLVAGVFNSGILADPRPGSTYDYAPAGEKIVRRARHLTERCRAYGWALPAAALQFVVGARTPREVVENVRHAAVRIPEPLWQELA